MARQVSALVGPPRRSRRIPRGASEAPPPAGRCDRPRRAPCVPQMPTGEERRPGRAGAPRQTAPARRKLPSEAAHRPSVNRCPRSESAAVAELSRARDILQSGQSQLFPTSPTHQPSWSQSCQTGEMELPDWPDLRRCLHSRLTDASAGCRLD